MPFLIKTPKQSLSFDNNYCHNSNYPFHKQDIAMTANEIGELVVYYRKKSGLSQQQLAQLAGIGKTAVFDIDKGKETVQLK